MHLRRSRRPSLRPVLLALVAASMPLTAARADDYPHVPEPMIFDMMRPLGAKRGELEANTLATAQLSGPERRIAWAPEIEYAFADGFAIEGELPFEGTRLAELKLGLQAAFGSFNHGQSAHGVQYLGIYDRHSGHYSNSLIYMLAHRFNRRWSNVAMAGLSDLSTKRGADRNAAILNNTLFYDASEASVLGVEVNYLGGGEGHVLVMPQLHQRLGSGINAQLGFGAQVPRGEKARPRMGLRLIREF